MSKKLLVLGSCRVIQPFQKDPDAVTYPGGHTHSTRDVLQAIRILNGDLVVPAEYEPYIFHGHGVRTPVQLSLKQFDRVVVELCSFKSYMHRPTELVFHIGYQDNVHHKKLTPVEGVVLETETPEQVLRNLDRIADRFSGKQLTIVSHNNIQQIPVRYHLSHLLSTWCYKHEHQFVDPTCLAAWYGIEKCFPVLNERFDLQHFTPFMLEKVRECIQDPSTLPPVHFYTHKFCPKM